MIDKQRLMALCEQAGVPITGGQAQQLDIYARLLCEWNEKINLTAITEPAEIEEKHFLDCLLPAKLVDIGGKVVDVGSGAGFPGMVLKVFCPDLQLTLMEPTGKRVAFLQELTQKLGLKVEIVKERAEEAAKKRWREQYDFAIARAVAALPVLCEYCLPLVKPGGRFLAMKGEAKAELAEAQNAVKTLGGGAARCFEYTLPSAGGRTLVVIDKEKPTPAAYPRGGGAIKKRPL